MGKNEYYKYKNYILIGVPTLISVLGVVIGLSNSFAYKITIILLEAVLFVILFLSLRYFGKKDAEEHKENEDLKLIVAHLEKQNSSYVKTLCYFSYFAEKWATMINLFANKVRTNAIVKENDWDKKRIYNSICVKCRDFIQDYVGVIDPSKISVGFIQCIDNDNEKSIVFVAHSNNGASRPSKFDCEEKLNESKYHYATLIKEEATDIEVACNNEEVRCLFKDVNPGSTLSKYTQYIAIPVYSSKRKMIGIFQVVAKHNYIIERDDIGLKKFAECALVPFSNMIILADGIYNGLYAKPNEEDSNEKNEEKGK